MALLRRYFPENLDSPVLFELSAETIQSIVAPNFGRALTEKEIERLSYSLLENFEAQDHLVCFILAAAKDATSSSESDWSGVDEAYEKRLPMGELGGYTIGVDNHLAC